jgi:hypothetical protein
MVVNSQTVRSAGSIPWSWHCTAVIFTGISYKFLQVPSSSPSEEAFDILQNNTWKIKAERREGY